MRDEILLLFLFYSSHSFSSSPILPFSHSLLLPISELKKRTKQRERDAAKAAKQASQPAPTAAASASATNASSNNQEPSDDDLTPAQFYERRCRQILRMRETRNPDPYPHKFHVSIGLPDYIEKFQNSLKEGEMLKDEKDSVSVAGRIHNIRPSGAKMIFYDLHAEGVKVQITAQAQ